MTAPNDVSSRILTAATLAEQVVAAPASIVSMVTVTDPDSDPGRAAHLGNRRIAASGPSHWGAVAEGLRSLLELHRPEMHTKYNVPCFDEFDSPTVVYRRCAGCHTRYFPGSAQSEANGCPSLAALSPLVDQIIRDLGDGQ